jgi:anthranilate phosphoribosyltransferase
VAEWRGGEISRYAVTPASFGLGGEVPISGPGSLWGGDARENALRARALLRAHPEEQRGAAWRSVVMTAAGALYVVGAGQDLAGAAARAQAALYEGRAWSALEALVRVSQE